MGIVWEGGAANFFTFWLLRRVAASCHRHATRRTGPRASRANAVLRWIQRVQCLLHAAEGYCQRGKLLSQFLAVGPEPDPLWCGAPSAENRGAFVPAPLAQPLRWVSRAGLQDRHFSTATERGPCALHELCPG
jgi:hypothetical protein